MFSASTPKSCGTWRRWIERVAGEGTSGKGRRHSGSAPRGALFPPDLAFEPEPESGACLSATHFGVWFALLKFARTREGDTLPSTIAPVCGSSVDSVRKALLRLVDLEFIRLADDTRPLRILRVPTEDAAPGLAANGKPITTPAAKAAKGGALKLTGIEEVGGAGRASKLHGRGAGTPNILPSKRRCMTCGTAFFSQGPHNRLCGKCRDTHDPGGDVYGFANAGRVTPRGEGPQ